MRVAVLSSSYPLSPQDGYAAAGLFVRDLCLELVRQGHEVFVLTQARHGEPIPDPNIRVIRFPWLGSKKRPADLRLKNPGDFLSILSFMIVGQLYLLILTRRYRIERVVALWAIPSGLWALLLNWLQGTPYTVWTLGSDIWVYGKGAFSRKMLRLILRNASRLFSDGFELQKETAAIAGKPVEFLASSRLISDQRPLENPGGDPTRKTFIYCGRFHPNKGTDLLLHALGLLSPESRNRMQMIVIGDGELKELVQSLIEKYDLSKIVHLTGFADAQTVAAYLRKADALIIPSRIESIPVVLSDALQMDCPLIATDVGDMGSLLREYAAGIVVKPEASAIAAGIEQMLNRNRAEFLGEIRRLYKKFDLKYTATRLLER